MQIEIQTVTHPSFVGQDWHVVGVTEDENNNVTAYIVERVTDEKAGLQ